MNMKTKTNRFLSVFLAVVIVAAFFAPGLSAQAAGTDTDGYTIITTAAELDTLVRNNLSGNFRLGNDIDLTGYTSTTNTAAKGWKGIGYTSGFTGNFDGAGYTISGLWSKGWGAYQGLFSVTKEATIKNVNVVLADAGITGTYEVGGLVGDARNGTVIENCTVSGGQVVVTGGGYAGGLVGKSYSASKYDGVTIKDCAVYGTLTSTSGNYSGGLVGVADDETQIINCYAIDTTSTGSSYVGGLVGGLKGASSITSSFSSGSATTKASYAGGLVGVVYEKSSIEKSCATGDVSAKHYGGGLVGTLYGSSTISTSCAYGNVTVTNYISGGLVGEAVASTISNCYAQGNVSGTTGTGGLVGYFSGSGSSGNKTVENSYSSGTVNGKSGSSEYGAFSGRSGVTFLGTNYYDSTTAGVSNAYGTAGTPKGDSSAFPQGKDTATMMKQSTFVGWDFDGIWKIEEGQTYPYFFFWDGIKGEEYTVRYNANGANGAYSETVTSGSYIIKSADEIGIGLENYTLIGWNLVADGSGEMYYPGDTIDVSEDITLYAMWGYSGGYYVSVTYVGNGGSGSLVIGGEIPNSDHTVLEVEDTGITRDPFTFVGWNTEADGSGIGYMPGDSVTVSENITLYAQWDYFGQFFAVTEDCNIKCERGSHL